LSGQKRKTVFEAILVGLLVLMIGVMYYFAFAPLPLTNPIPPVPASEDPPNNRYDFQPIQVGTLQLNATANATGMIPHQGPMTFRMHLVINITNIGSEDINDFHAVKTSVYNTDNELFYTFSFQYDWNATIPAGETVQLSYHNNQTRIEFPFEPWEVYARVLVTFDVNREVIITTPIIDELFAIE
jgi:hypothetical protein